MSLLIRRRRTPALLVVALAVLLAAVATAQDWATVQLSNSAPPGTTVEIPVFVGDLAGTALGVDQAAGSRIQSLAFKVTFAPSAPLVSKLFARAGITAGLAPTLEAAPTTATTASYLATFDETTQPIPFTLDATLPGDQVLKLTVTLAADAPAGPITLTLDPATTELANQAGTTAETQANGGLALSDGVLHVVSNAVIALRSHATSSASIRLDWWVPGQNETGFRVERSTDGASWSPVATLGPDDLSYLDAVGLSPATLYSYRLVTLIPADSHVSHVTAASTWPAAAAKVCPQAVATPPRSWTAAPSVAWDGAAWGVAWLGREGAVEDEIWFQRFAAATLDPLGSPVRVAASAGAADILRSHRPTLASNGSGYGVIWTEGLPGEPGTPLANTTFFARLDASGNVVRGGVRLSSTSDSHPWEDGLPPPLAWDGTHWGVFDLSYTTPPMLDLIYRRLDDDGDVVLGPVTVRAPADAHVSDIDAAWNPVAGKYGLLWHQIRDDDIEVWFQILEESTGALEGSPTLLDDYVSVIGTYGGSVVADGDGWAVAWTDLEIDPEDGAIGVTWMRRFDASGAAHGAATRLSDDPVTDGGGPLLARKPAGGFAAFVYCGEVPYEICRLEADASGVRFGALDNVTPEDGFNSYIHDVAGNGSDFLVAFQERGSGTAELGGSLVPVGDNSTPGPVTLLTSGHEATNAVPGNGSVVPVGAGFAAVWVDPTPGVNRIDARIWDGAGSTVAALSPLTPTPSAGRPAVVGVGDQFAVAWQGAATTDRWFARFDATGAPLLGETSISTQGNTNVMAMDFTGDSYGLLWRRSGGFNFVLVAPDGTRLVEDLLVPLSGVASSPPPQMRWTGGGFAVVWRGGDNSLHYTFLAPDGTPVVLNTQLTTGVQYDWPLSFQLVWTGVDLGLAWSELRDVDPPLDDIHFVRLGLDGTMAFAPVTVVSTPRRDLNPQLYWTAGDARFHLVHSSSGVAGAREIEIQSDGAVLPGERFWTNRTLPALAWNGVTPGYLIGADGNLFFETGECVTADATAPPCPALTVGSFGELVRLDWSAVADPQSGIFRYHVYRDGLALGHTDAATTLFDDAGFGIGATHTYQVRALDGAWNESDACPTVSYSTTAGDANGDGAYGVADIFYLINFFFADGPPPAGNADANGDDAVSVTDIFYMINDLFADGPPPVPRGQVVETPARARVAAGSEAARAPAIDAAGKSWLVAGRGSGAPGHTVRIPIDLYDAPGTPLGAERPFGERIQALALQVRCAPCDAVSALAVEPAGALAAATPSFQSRPSGPASAALIATYDEAAGMLFATSSSSRSRQRVAWVVVQIAAGAHSGNRFELRLDPGTTALSNDGGTLFESIGNGWLKLGDGWVTVGAPPRVAWR